MTDRIQVARDIQQVLDTESSAVRLSNRRFTPGGLFSKLFSTPDEKRAVMASELFATAQRRLSELQFQEAGRLVKGGQPIIAGTAGFAHIEQLHPTTTG